MITVGTFLALVGVELALFLYMFVDLDNRLYGNMFAGGFGGVLAGLLALWSFNGNIGTTETVINTTTINETIGETVYTYTTQTTTMVDPTLGWFWVFWMGSMVALVAYFCLEAWIEKSTPEEEDY